MAAETNPTTTTTPDGSPTILPVDATADDLERDTLYLGAVNNVKPYGVFVALTPETGTDVSALAHASNLPPLSQPLDYSEGERVAVEVVDGHGDDADFAFAIAASEHGSGRNDVVLPDIDPRERNPNQDALLDATQLEDASTGYDVEESSVVADAVQKIERLSESGRSATEVTERRTQDGSVAVTVTFDPVE